MSKKYYGVNELRQMFLDFFKSKEHLTRGSYSLVPHNDKSLLLINAGMAPLKPYFTGQEIPPNRRMATCQKCIRTGDIDNVGKTARHGTFFEMLGNFSFGDYFKHEAIAWTWEFLTQVVGLEADRLYPSVYKDDDEAWNIWHDEIGVPADRIFRFGKEDNFWEHGSGPCGPCSEVYYDRGEKYGCGKPGCTVGCDCDRYMEVWNNVFTQFNGDGKGNYEELANKNIDTGMGLERLAVVVQDVDSIFEVDTIKSLLDRVAEIAHTEYKENAEKDVSLRLITDHIRSCTFMASDGILPSNEGRGYVFRRLLRRAARHGLKLGIEGKFLAELAKTVIDSSKDGYPELEEKRDMILSVLTSEEDKFSQTINQGLEILDEIEKDMTAGNKQTLTGENAFKLYDTYGFPIDLTVEILEEKGFKVDLDGFNECMKKQKETARKARKVTNYMGADANVYDELDPGLSTLFVGYDSLLSSGRIIALTSETEIVDALTEGQRGTIITDSTPFYATKGGQQADIGVIEDQSARFTVEDVIPLKGGKIGHVGYMESGTFNLNDVVEMKVDADNRKSTCRNHSCTHLLQMALRKVLGNHVEQSGSMVSYDRLRFDFTHFQAVTSAELHKVEELVNAEIRKSNPVVTDVMSIEDAKKTGAMALFGEKYGSSVRVVTMGDSKEFCGGTHVKNTADIFAFKIVSESGIAAGVRRIEALTGDNVMNYYQNLESQIFDIAKLLKTNPDGIMQRVQSMQDEIKSLKAEADKAKAQYAQYMMKKMDDDISEINGIKYVTRQIDNIGMDELRNYGDMLKDKTEGGIAVLAGINEGKVNLMVTCGQAALDKGAHAGNIIKAIASCVGGGGGGRPNMAQAGGKNPEGIADAFVKAAEVIGEQTK
ncbi:MAG: alanine--tRNA ligase [Lachnospiraceae bacterium]|nr:alanine--tRNA ligase [Lachnospiraceae bacterium]